jgi:hypothetical protein
MREVRLAIDHSAKYEAGFKTNLSIATAEAIKFIGPKSYHGEQIIEVSMG